MLSRQSQFNKANFVRFCLAVCLFLPAIPAPGFAATCEKVHSETTGRKELLDKIFGPGRLRGADKGKRREIEAILFKDSRSKFLKFWSQLEMISEKEGSIAAQKAVRWIDRFHFELFEGRSLNEYSFATVLQLAKVIQRHLEPSMRDDSYYVIFGGSFPNGKASLKDSDIDAWISVSLFRSDLDILNKQFSAADSDIRNYLGRNDKVISEDFVSLNEGLPGAPFMDYNSIVVLIHATNIRIGVYDSATNRRLIIPISE